METKIEENGNEISRLNNIPGISGVQKFLHLPVVLLPLKQTECRVRRRERRWNLREKERSVRESVMELLRAKWLKKPKKLFFGLLRRKGMVSFLLY